MTLLIVVLDLSCRR